VSNHNGLQDIIKDDNSLIKCREDRVKEGKSINKSLFFLTQVISMKSEGKTEHIPYRNSPLTKILKSSLGGNSRTFIVLCTTPMHGQYEQTLGTIRFGMSAKKIENVICANITAHNSGEAYQLMINEYETRLKEMEKLRGADKQKVEYMVNIIAELQRQKDLLNERLRKANEKRLMRGPVVKCKIKEAVKKDYHKEGIGLIFTNAKANYMNEVVSEAVNDTSIELRKETLALAALRNEKAKNEILSAKVEVLRSGLNDITNKTIDEINIRDKNIEILNTQNVSTCIIIIGRSNEKE